MQYKEIMRIYRMNPIESFENILLEQDQIIDDICNCILVILFAFDESIRKKSKKNYYYYIEDVNSIFYIIFILRLRNISRNQFEKSIFKLDFSKLIYKFTCAKKFRIKDDSVCQLRINSWGREYIKYKELLNKYRDEYFQIREFCDSYYDSNQIFYDRLTEMLLQEIDRYTSLKIKKINEKLNIKILS